MSRRLEYGPAIREAFEWLLTEHAEVFTIGQGLWSPWYVGNSMTDLDTQFGVDRVIDTPISELATTGAALGAALAGYRPIVIHPRIDFMLLAVDQIVNQAAKWCSMFGGDIPVPLTIRGIINRGGEQGAQHSQALHSWFAHVPGLRVVMPATPGDARDLLIASVLCDDPVLYIDDRWLYGVDEEVEDPAEPLDLTTEGPRCLRSGSDVTLVGAGHATQLCLEAAQELDSLGTAAEVIDLRVLNPLDLSLVKASAERTGRLVVVDGDWKSCGLASEVVASVHEASSKGRSVISRRVTLPDAPAPTSRALESSYYIQVADVVEAVTETGES